GEVTDAAFQPTIMPLVNYWGFGYTEKRAVTSVDSLRVDTLLSYIGLDKIQLTEDSLIKLNPDVQLDFSGIAKGYGADLIAERFKAKGINDYFIEIGGDVLANGLSPRGDDWVFGITVPLPEAGLMEFMTTAPLKNRAVATSGNYRNYFEVEGEKYGHTINPYNGFPEKNSLLSVSAFAKDGATADAFATACMVMGYEKASQLAEANPELEAYFIVGMPDGSMKTYFSSGLFEIFKD
ncbi:MAG: FAD:protein FMN transferase, partial [Bacteroidota bacterium]